MEMESKFPSKKQLIMYNLSKTYSWKLQRKSEKYH